MIDTWRIGSDTPEYTAEDMGSVGVKTTVGRWNSAGCEIASKLPPIRIDLTGSNRPRRAILGFQSSGSYAAVAVIRQK